MGLKPKHHAELNLPPVKRKRFDELRREYANDQEALREIDKYDPKSAYRSHIEAYKNAMRDGDAEAEKREEAWLQQHEYVSG